jgi:iron complex outermembrane receptor protein
MKTKLFLLFLVILSCGQKVFSQTLSGTVYSIADDSTISVVPFAKLYIAEIELGTIANDQGFFEFKVALPESVQLLVTAPECESALIKVASRNSQIIYLQQRHLELDEVTVSGSKESLSRQSVVHIESRKLNELNAIPAGGLVEAITSIPGVYRSSTGNGISKPVIRGLQGIRVVTLLNGMRIENQQWGGDHSLGITDLGIGSVEVIKGPASLLFGADALGGVLYFTDEKYIDNGTTEVRFRSVNESNTLGTSNQLTLKTTLKNVRFNAGGSMSNHADFIAPTNLIANNTRYNDYTGKVSLGMNKGIWAMHVRYTFNRTRVGIPGELTDSLGNTILWSDAQDRKISAPSQLYNNQFISVENSFFKRRNVFTLLVGQTFGRLSEFEESLDFPGMNMLLSNSIVNFRIKSQLNERWTLISGYQSMNQVNRNLPDAEEQLIPNAISADNGVYSIAFYKRKNWDVQFGGRYDVRLLDAEQSAEGGASFRKLFNGVNFSAGAVYNLANQTFRLNLSSGFRAPHYSEILANGVHHGAMRYEIGDRNLTSERALQIDATIEHHGEHLELILNPYANYIQDFISIQPIDSIIDGLPVYRFGQLNNVMYYGMDLGLHYHPHFAHWLHYETTLSFIQTDVFGSENVALLPQNRWSNVLRIVMNPNWKISPEDLVVQFHYFAGQNSVATYESASSPYKLLNIGMNFKTRGYHAFKIGVGVRNVLNESYIDHLSRLKNIGMYSPGRNIYLSLNYTFIHRGKNFYAK